MAATRKGSVPPGPASKVSGSRPVIIGKPIGEEGTGTWREGLAAQVPVRLI